MLIFGVCVVFFLIFLSQMQYVNKSNPVAKYTLKRIKCRYQSLITLIKFGVDAHFSD